MQEDGKGILCSKLQVVRIVVNKYPSGCPEHEVVDVMEADFTGNDLVSLSAERKAPCRW